MLTNYYLIDMKTNYNIRFYSQIISNAYNNFVVIAFSHSVSSVIGSSFFILSYPNSSDHTYDIIDEIKMQQRSIDKLCFYLNETLVIENNLFEYEFYGTKIISFSDEIELKQNNDIIQKNSDFILLKDKCIIISFPKENDIYRANSFNIEIAYVVKETVNADLTGYTQKTLTGKYANYSFIINNDIYCLDDNCLICNESPICLICDNNIKINAFKNKCGFSFTTNLITEIETYYSTAIPSEKITEKIEVTSSKVETEDSTQKININTPSTINNNDINIKTESIILNISDSIIEYNNICPLDDII